MNVDSGQYRRELAGAIVATGVLTDPALREAVESVPRELFLGEAVYRPEGAAWVPVRREEVGEAEWIGMACADRTWVTQVDGLDADRADVPVTGSPTSSSTLPSLVVRMLQLADLREGSSVLEIGTGTGYSTAILAHRLGDGRVTSVEYDPGVARRAAARLDAAGYSPFLVVGDGLQGHKERAEYDAVVATCAVRHIPPSWLWQVRVGGTVTTTLSGWMLASGLIRLTVAEDGSASGRFTGDPVSYMPARPHERPPRPAFFRRRGITRSGRVDPVVLDDWTGHFVAQLAAPSAEVMTTGDGPVLVDVATGSQAWTEPSGSGWTVHQHGPLRLWDQVEEAILLWQGAGAPDQSRFGMTVDAEHAQTVWIGSPDGPSWQLPA
ncbi:ATP-grasp peptide maturase system methyltransferase [Streptomyces eurocidicus]|uniref:Protein-L-isoaspartate O-methyltransferase n=1 Tax=Streptomyces eurocidicus TaxID=66423 RepID=A0A7W8F3L0_STREU|nr:ATP-grasp peptide maturase system methyltransferase [Streptomyces eurocidicus]MBB5119960.1 methyltransferase of ATP-grasp peptide maturase system [Streptomyces eurocidicus]MBF6051786.1 methyltransferase domain-containing protein [Streptomyces eurocidicus]